MSLPGVALVLSPEERELVEALREIPESPLRRKLVRLTRDLFAFGQSPACGGTQGDGTPCDNPHAQCDQCSRVTRVLDALANRFAEQDGNG
jgi:hypothetical protein